jgi:hypothetical protein
MLLNVCIYIVRLRTTSHGVYIIYIRPLSVQAQYSRSCPIISSSCYNSRVVTWTVVCLTAAKFKPCSHYSLYSLGTDRIEKTSPDSSSFDASRSYRTERVKNIACQSFHCYILIICCLATGVFAEPFPSNGCLCWLHSSCLKQICYNMYMTLRQVPIPANKTVRRLQLYALVCTQGASD